MNITRLKSLIASVAIVAGSLPTSMLVAQTYIPQQTYVPQQTYIPQQTYQVPSQYNTVPQYNSVPAVNQVPNNFSYGPVTSSQSTLSNGKPAWFQGLAEKRAHDFGVVARSSKQEHVFEFENTTDNDIFLTSVQTSCGCTKPTILTPHVKPGGTAQVNAKYDTQNFYGPKSATVTVSLQKAGPVSETGEVQFSVKGTIRRDVVLNPGEVVFDNVVVSESLQRTVRVSYTGDANWRIEAIKSTNPNMEAEAREVERNGLTRRVSYDLVVKLKNGLEPGAINEWLTIVTNDPTTTGMPVAVKGMVKPLIEVSSIQLGVVNRGQAIQKKLILRCQRAVFVKEVKAADPRIQFGPVDGEKTLHILSYSLDTSQPGNIDEEVTILTSDPCQPEAYVPFSVQIVPATTTDQKK